MLKRIKHLYKKIKKKRELRKVEKQEQEELQVNVDKYLKENLFEVILEKPKLYNIELELNGEQYEYNNVINYELTLSSNNIVMDFEGKSIASKYDIVHITEI